MPYRCILVAVDDSPAGLEAARTAVELAAGNGAPLRAVTVLRDHVLERALGGEPDRTAHHLAEGAQSVLTWVEELAAGRQVSCQTVLRGGEPYREILSEADACDADVIVIGRSDRRGPRSPYLGSETAQVLEFAEVPVLVVPRRPS